MAGEDAWGLVAGQEGRGSYPPVVQVGRANEWQQQLHPLPLHAAAPCSLDSLSGLLRLLGWPVRDGDDPVHAAPQDEEFRPEVGWRGVG